MAEGLLKNGFCLYNCFVDFFGGIIYNNNMNSEYNDNFILNKDSIKSFGCCNHCSALGGFFV